MVGIDSSQYKQNTDFWKLYLKKWTALDPPDRISEVLFGLIMVLTFVGSISVSTDGRQEVRELLWAALGCNLAWGMVDAIMNLMDVFLNRKYVMAQIKQLRRVGKPDLLRTIIRENIPPLISELMDDTEIDQLAGKFKKLPEPDLRYPLTVKDFLVAVEIFLLVFLSTFPVALPFILINEVALALRVSNGIALILLFAGGYALAKYAGLKPGITALVYMAIGIFLVALTMALGG
jgi:hypothetical protein